MELNNKTFENAKRTITSLIEDYDIKYPLDIFELCKKMEFEVIPYSTFGNHIELLKKNSFDGFSNYFEDKKTWSIFYNENVKPKERRKFTIAHEIGHILLQTQDEGLANFFAGYLLAPAVLIIEYKMSSVEEVMEYFKVGYQCAQSSLNRAKSRILHKAPYSDYEKAIIKSQYYFCGNDHKD